MQNHQNLDMKQQCKNCLSLYRSLYQAKKENFELTQKLRDLEGAISLREGSIKSLEEKLQYSYNINKKLQEEVDRLEKVEQYLLIELK